jgi:predicted metal-dependent hydrolase
LGRPLAPGAVGIERQAEGVARTPKQTLVEAQRLLAAGRPFHAHEVFEDAWKSAPAGPEREFWRAMAQLAVGATHAARGNRSGAVSLLRRGIATIDAHAAGAPDGVDVSAIGRWAAEAIARVEAESPVQLPAPPLA